MSKIARIHAREILDSRGNPTIEVEVITDTGVVGRAKVPSGKSTGKREAHELRDREERYGGMGVKRAVGHIVGPLARLLEGRSIYAQKEIDYAMIALDGTGDKEALGANAILGVSLAVAKAGARCQRCPLYRYISGKRAPSLPIPMLNILNGGVHADNGLDFQEFMIRPIGAPSFSEGIRWSVEIFHALKALLRERGEAAPQGEEGGVAPHLQSDEEALSLIVEAIARGGYRPGEEISLAVDCAASEFYDAGKKAYLIRGEDRRSTREQIGYLEDLTSKFPIDTIEDGLDEGDWRGWELLTRRLQKGLQLVGDDIFATNAKLLKRGVDLGIGNAILIKMNQIGTLTETLQTIALAHQHGYQTVISHRSGETEDTFIADLSVATGAGQIKTGPPVHAERTAKYNRLMAIEEELGGLVGI